MTRCPWPKLNTSTIYQTYHDTEWGVASYDDAYIFEMLVLESFHCGLSWLLILSKRDNFRRAFDNFDPVLISKYDEVKIDELMHNEGIVRNKLKVLATIQNAKSFLSVQKEFKSFSNYIWSFTDNKILKFPFDACTSKNELSDRVSKDLKKRGFKFLGSVTVFSFLEAIGIMNNHSTDCFLYSLGDNDD